MFVLTLYLAIQINLLFCLLFRLSPYNFLARLRRLKNCTSEDKDWFLQGLCTGFSLGCSSKTLISANRNISSTYQPPKVINDYLKSEIEFNYIAGPSKQPTQPSY